jgi:hypothetical protein
MADVTDKSSAWHYSEEKQQFHFRCDTKGCNAETDILGHYGFCPRCGRTNARKLFSERMNKMLSRLEEIKQTVSDRGERGANWEDMIVKSLSEFEALAKHLRNRLLRFPMTSNRRKCVEGLNFQNPLQAHESLELWFDIGILKWPGDDATPGRAVLDAELAFVRKMIQRRHILMHNGGIVDQDYLNRSGDAQVRLNERIRIGSHEAKRFIESVRGMGANLLDNVEHRFTEG